MNVNDLRNLFSLEIREISDVSEELFLSWLNRIEAEIYPIANDANPSNYFNKSEISVISDENEYELPSDFGRLDLYGCGVFEVDKNNEVEKLLCRTTYGSLQLGYFLNGNKIIFTPIPSENKTIKINYLKKRTELTSTDNDLTIDDIWESAIIEGLKKMYFAWEEDSANEVMADQRYARLLGEISKKNRVNEISSLPDTSLYFS